MLDLLLVNVPGTIDFHPPAAPAVLRAAVEQAGFSCSTLDINIEFYNSGLLNIPELETYFTIGINSHVEEDAISFLQSWAEKIVAINPKFLGISVFTYQNRTATKILCTQIRKLSNTIRIILGGQGLHDVGIMGNQGYANDMLSEKLCDFYIRSEGEISLVELLKGNSNYPGINSTNFIQNDNLETLPIPNYDDYNFTKYKSKIFPVTMSRGCVRQCTYCDIHEHWSYNTRSGAKVFEEMKQIKEKYGAQSFYFTDSLVNGSLREFNKLIQLLADYNTTHIDKISWSGQFIVRPLKQLNEQHFVNLSLSQAENLAIGVETGSDKVRQHMKKNFSNKDLDDTMEMFSKYNITCKFLMIFGYPTETEEDFQDTLNMFTRYKKYANRVITDVNFGTALTILPGTDLYRHATSYNIVLDKYESNWISNENPDLTFEKRLARRHYARQFVENLGYELKEDFDKFSLQYMENLIPVFNRRNKIKTLMMKKIV